MKQESTAPDAAYLELLASYEAAFEIAKRCLTIAQTFAEGYRSGVRPPDVILDASLATFDRDQAQLTELQAKVAEFKSWFRIH